MPKPKCLHSQEQTEKHIEEILKLLKGDNSHGLVTKMALIRQSVARVWWWVGGISISLMAIAFFVIRGYLLKGG